MRSLRGVEKKVHLADGAEWRTRPDPPLPARAQTGKGLARELASQLGLELAVLRVRDSIPTRRLLPALCFLTLNREFDAAQLMRRVNERFGLRSTIGSFTIASRVSHEERQRQSWPERELWRTAMTQRERQGWLIVAALFVALLLIFGSGYNTVPVFVPALLTAFPHWSRAQVFPIAERVGTLGRCQRSADRMASRPC